jgi:hypothetical protein
MIAVASNTFDLVWQWLLRIVIRVVVIVRKRKELSTFYSPRHRHRSLRFLGNLNVFWSTDRLGTG